jgi:hypothetical protein
MKNTIPSNIREAVLSGMDLLAAPLSAEDRFTGPSTVTRTGQVESEDGFVIPFVAKLQFGRPRAIGAHETTRRGQR